MLSHKMSFPEARKRIDSFFWLVGSERGVSFGASEKRVSLGSDPRLTKGSTVACRLEDPCPMFGG